MKMYFPNQPTREQVETVLQHLLKGETLSSAVIRAMGIQPRMVISTLRHKLHIPIMTLESVVEGGADIEEMALYFDADYSEEGEPDAVGVKCFAYRMAAAEITRYYEDREGQIRDYREIIRLNVMRRAAQTTTRVLRRKGEPVPESVTRDAAMKIPAVTDGTSKIGQVVYVNFQQPAAANDSEFVPARQEKNGGQ